MVWFLSDETANLRRRGVGLRDIIGVDQGTCTGLLPWVWYLRLQNLMFIPQSKPTKRESQRWDCNCAYLCLNIYTSIHMSLNNLETSREIWKLSCCTCSPGVHLIRKKLISCNDLGTRIYSREKLAEIILEAQIGEVCLDFKKWLFHWDLSLFDYTESVSFIFDQCIFF